MIGMETAAEVWGGDQDDVRLPVKDAGLEPARSPREDEEGEHDDAPVLCQDEGAR